MRLRTAYGASGVQPGTIDAVPYYAATRTQGESGEVPGVVFTALGNTNLKPERSTELEAGFDATFWRGKVNTQITYYNKISRDALVSRVLPPSLGTGNTSRFENLGEVRNTGWEALINTVLLQSSSLGWDFTVSGSSNANKLVSLGGVPNIIISSTQQHREGYPLYGWWSRPLLGWQDKNNDGTADVGGLVMEGALNPFGIATIPIGELKGDLLLVRLRTGSATITFLPAACNIRSTTGRGSGRKWHRLACMIT